MPPIHRDELLARRRVALATRHRRRTTLVGISTLAAVALAAGIALGAGSADEPAPAPPAPEPLLELRPLPELSDVELAGQRLIAGFSGGDVPSGLKREVRAGRIAGVVLFAANVGGRAETRRLIAELQGIRRPEGLESPLLVMADQEGGQVKRVPGPPDASGEQMGARGAEYAAEQGRATARSLSDLGINVDLAPVLDVGRRGSAISREDRSFGSRPGTVIGSAVGGFARGLREGGVAATAKHFPGFGAAEVNTDIAAQRIQVSKAKLRRTDEAPFDAFADAGGELIMLAVASYRAFGERPAALNRAIATGELRGRVGFEGVSITDSLDAAAVQAFAGRDRVATLAADAGSDLLLYGDWRTARAAGRTLSARLRSGALERGEFEASVKRVLALRAELGR